MKALSYLGNLPQLVESLLYQSQLFQIALNLLIKISRQVLLLFNMNILVVHLLKSIYKSIFEGGFTLYWHISSFLSLHLQEYGYSSISPTKITDFYEKHNYGVVFLCK